MKKKLVAIFLCVALVAVGIVGASLAYFTDTDEATNTFTTTNVDIQLIEQQRNADGSELEPFQADKVLYPLVGSAQGAKDKFGLSTAKNYVDKIVTVKNLAADAFVRVYYAIPSALDNVDAGKNVLHMNSGNKFTAAGDYDTTANPQPENANFKSHMGVEHSLVTNFDIDGVKYNIYYRDYAKVLTKDEVTGSAFIVGMYLDSGVDYVPAEGENLAYYTINGQKIDFDFSAGVKIPVFAVGVQAKGFEDVGCAAAIKAAFGESYNPWAPTP